MTRVCCALAALLVSPITDCFAAQERLDLVVRYAQVAQGVKDAEKSVVETANSAKETVEKTGQAAASKIEDLWRRVDENRLKNRTPDEIAAWLIMGIVVGALAGMLTSLNTTAFGKLGRLLLGLGGAFIGGMIVHVGRIDFGLGPVMIRYEDLLFSFLGALLLLLVMHMIRFRSRKN